MQSNGKKRNASRSTAQNKICQLDRAVVPVSNAIKKVQRRSLIKKGYELSKSIKGPTVTQKIVPVFTATANKKANSERVNDGPWMQNDKAELGKKDRAVVPVSCTNYFIGLSFFFF